MVITGSVVTIVGPTGVGKSGLAVHLARQFNGEIVNADSRQVYRYMDIGTAKPRLEERLLVSHHLIDIVDPDEDFSLAQYQALAYKVIADIQQRGKLPIMVGGSGLYVWAVVEGWEIPKVAPQPQLRRQMEQRADAGEEAALYEELTHLDPEAAKKIDPRNVRRVIRALEVTQTGRAPFSKLQKKSAPPFQTLMIGLTADRSELYRRTDARVDRMIELGLIEEVKDFIKMGYGFDLPAMSGIGYHQIGEYIDGKLTLEETVRQIKIQTHRYVRHQYNWFRLNDARIKWFDIHDGEMESRVSGEVERLVGRT